MAKMMIKTTLLLPLAILFCLVTTPAVAFLGPSTSTARSGGGNVKVVETLLYAAAESSSSSSSASSETKKSQGSIPEPEIAHLQKKLRYWKSQQVKKQKEYKDYIMHVNIENKAKPIYERRGKIDIYKQRPVYDKESERIQTEVWSIKEKIILAQAKIDEEKRVLSATVETRERLKQQEEQIHRMKDESTKKLTEKEHEIETLAHDIESLSSNLQEKRSELEVKDEVLHSLEDDLKTKESILYNLERERSSLRCLVRQSFKVLTGRLTKRLHLPHRGGNHDHDADKEEGSMTHEVAAATMTVDAPADVTVNGDGQTLSTELKP